MAIGTKSEAQKGKNGLKNYQRILMTYGTIKSWSNIEEISKMVKREIKRNISINDDPQFPKFDEKILIYKCKNHNEPQTRWT